jgi:UDP-glucose 4-epimerase
MNMKKIIGANINRVFITGGAGFIGSHLCDTLISEGYKVSVYDNFSNGKILSIPIYTPINFSGDLFVLIFVCI